MCEHIGFWQTLYPKVTTPLLVEDKAAAMVCCVAGMKISSEKRKKSA